MAKFFVGNGTNWSSTSSWSTSSGGASGAAVPTSSDDVVFDANSPGNCTLDANSSCQSIDFTGFTHTFTHNASTSLNIGGSVAGPSNVLFRLVSGMTYTLGSGFTSAVNFVSSVATAQKITVAGKTLGNVNFSASGGSWQLQDTFKCATFTHTQGTIDTNSQSVQCNGFLSNNNNTRSFIFGTSTFTITGTSAGDLWIIAGSGITYSGTPNLTFSGSTSNARNFKGGGFAYGTITYTVNGSTGSLTIFGSNTINTLNFTDNNNVRTLTFQNGTTNTIAIFNVNGNASFNVTVNSDSAGNAATISVASGRVAVNFLTIKDNTATGGATFMDYNGVQQTNVTGWNFNGTLSSNLSDSISPSESFLRSTSKSLSGSISLVETMIKAIVKITFSDSISLTETFLPKAISKFFNDNISTSETFSWNAIFGRILTDSISPAESLIKALNKVLSNISMSSDSGFAIQFPGIEGYITLGVLGNFGSNLANGFFCQIKMKANINSQQSLGGTLVSGGEGIQILWNTASNQSYQQNGIKLSIRDKNNKFLAAGITSPTININDGNIHVVKLTANFPTNTITITIDNVVQTISYSNQDTPSSFINLTTPFLLGTIYNSGPSGLWPLTVDDFQIGTSSAVLYGSYNMNDGPGSQTIADQSGNSNNGTLTSTITNGALPAFVTGLTTDNTLKKFTSKSFSESVSFVESIRKTPGKLLNDSISFIESFLRFTNKFFIDYGPTIWSGIGINYNNPNTPNGLTADLALFKSVGITKIRALIVLYTGTSTITQWRGIVTTMLSQGFYVIYGLTSNGITLTAANWPTFAAAVIAEATWAQSVGLNEFQVGNEEELHNDNTTLTDAQLRTNLRALATSVKAVFSGVVTYSTSTSIGLMDTWGSEGLGGLDKLGINVYGGGTTLDFNNFRNIITHAINSIGLSKFYISEFGVSTSGFNTVAGMTDSLWASDTGQLLAFIVASNISSACFYNFYDGSNNFGVIMNTGIFRMVWGTLLTFGNESLQRAIIKIFTNAVSLIESLTWFFSRLFTDSVSFVENILKTTGKFFIEIISLSQTFFTVFNGVIELTDIVILNDALNKSLTRSLTDSISFIENFTKLTCKLLAEAAIFLNENFFPYVMTKAFTESVSLVERFLKVSPKAFTESPIILNESFGRLFTKSFKDTVTFIEKAIRSRMGWRKIPKIF